MADRKNLCALIPTEMHDRVNREREKLGMTNSDYVLKVLTEYYDMMENGGANMKATEKGRERTLAFPVSVAYDYMIGSRHDFHLFRDSGVHFSKDIEAVEDKGYQGLQKLHKNSTIPAKASKNHELNFLAL